MGIARLGCYPYRFHPDQAQKRYADTNADHSGPDADTDASVHADANADASGDDADTNADAADDADANTAAARTRADHDPVIWNRPGIRRARRSP